MILRDAEIRQKLKVYLSKLRHKPKLIIDELHVHRGNAIADIVAIYNFAHCYEIKGETDNIARVVSQGQYYDLVFKKVTLVTTKNHLKKALSIAPEHWGLIVTYTSGKEVKFKHYRKASNSPKFNKELALATLWREEMLKVIDKNELSVSKKANKRELASLVAEELTNDKVSIEIAESLLMREEIRSHSA